MRENYFEFHLKVFARKNFYMKSCWLFGYCLLKKHNYDDVKYTTDFEDSTDC